MFTKEEVRFWIGNVDPEDNMIEIITDIANEVYPVDILKLDIKSTVSGEKIK